MISVAPGEGLFYSIIPVAQGDGKNIMKVNKQITNITFDDFLHMLNNITHESKKNAIAYNTL
jgi:hypothetical protein